MRARGINYDTGFLPGREVSRKRFTSKAVRHDMAVISGELHCGAVRVSGRKPDRLLPFLADRATRAEAVRETGAEVVSVAGCEISAFCGGFLPGDTYGDRIRALAADTEWWSSPGPVQERLDDFLSGIAATVRTRFGGRVTYASAP